MHSHHYTIKMLKDPKMEGDSKSIILSRILSFLDDKDVASLNTIRQFRGDISQENPLSKSILFPPHYSKKIPKQVYRNLNKWCERNCSDKVNVRYNYICLDSASGSNSGSFSQGKCYKVILCKESALEPRCHGIALSILFCPYYTPRVCCTILSAIPAAISSIYGFAKDELYPYEKQIEKRKKEPGIGLKRFSIYAEKIRSEKNPSLPIDQTMEEKRQELIKQ